MTDDSGFREQKLVADAERLILAGDFAGALPLLESAGRSALEHGRAREGALTLISAARLSALLGQTDRTEALLAAAEPAAAAAERVAELLQARAEVAEASGDAGAARASWQALAAADDEGARLVGLLRLAELSMAAGEPAKAAALYEQAIALANDDAATVLVLDRAVALIAAGEVITAERELRLIEDRLAGQPALRARMFALLATAAMRRGDRELALERARAARSLAELANDPINFLPAVGLISMLFLDAGEEVEAYDELIRARSRLKQLLGPEGAEMLTPALAAFAQRLGDRYEDVRARWVAYRSGPGGSGPSGPR